MTRHRMFSRMIDEELDRQLVAFRELEDTSPLVNKGRRNWFYMLSEEKRARIGLEAVT